MAADRTKRDDVPRTGRRGNRTGDDPRVVYIPREDATPEGELAALARAYEFVLDRRERAERPKLTGRDVAEASSADL